MFKRIRLLLIVCVTVLLATYQAWSKADPHIYKSFEFDYKQKADVLITHQFLPMSAVADLEVIMRIDKAQSGNSHNAGAYTVRLNAGDLASLKTIRFCGEGATTGLINLTILTDTNDIISTQLIKWNTEIWEEGQVAIQNSEMGLRFPCRKQDGKAFEYILEKIIPLELRGGKSIGSSGLLEEILPENISVKFDIFGVSSEGGATEINTQHGVLTKLSIVSYGAIGHTKLLYSKADKETIQTTKYFPHTKLKPETSKLDLQQFGNTFLLKSYIGEYDMQTSCLIGEIFRHAKQYHKIKDVPDLQSNCVHQGR